jgi:hypothetical protein
VWEGRPNVILFYPGESRQTPVYVRSGEKPARIIGFKIGWFIVDEADSCKKAAYVRAAERCRDSRVERLGHTRQKILGYTPEPGFNWTYKMFHEKQPKNMHLIQGISTTLNTDNPPEYAAEISAVNDDEQRERVLTGKRTALTGNVYKRFDRDRHNRVIADPFAGDVFIGADFNWLKMVWVFGSRIGDDIYIWGELVREHTDTIAQCEAAEQFLAEAFLRTRGVRISPQKIVGKVQLVPDASCNQRRTSSAGTASDLDHLIKAGFDVRRPSANPPIIDRVYSMNIGFSENRIFVDVDRCPHLTTCLVSQPWDEARQEPSKRGGLDHGPDAMGYPVHFYQPRAIMRGNGQGRGRAK